MAEQIVGGSSGSSSSRIELEAHYLRIFLNNYQNSDFINRVPNSTKSTLKFVFCPEEKTVNLDGTLIYVSNMDNGKFEAGKHKKFSFTYSVPMDRLSRLQIKSSRKGKKSDNNYTNTFSFKLTKSDARRLFTQLQMGHKAIKKRFKTPSNNNMSKSSNSNPSNLFYKRQRQLKTVVIYLDKLPQKDLQDLSKIFYFSSKIKMDKLSVHTLLYGDKSGSPTPQQRFLKKTLKFSKELISKMSLLDETKSDGLIISENLEISFHEKRILFFVIYNDTRIEHCLEGTQILGFELINSENCTSIHLAVEQLEARRICSKLIQPAPKMQRITMMIAKFVKAENKGNKMEMDQCTIRIHFKKMFEQEQIDHLKHIFPVIGKFPATRPKEGYLNFENDEVMDNDNDNIDTDLLDKMPSDQELSDVEEEEELKPLNLDAKKLKIDQHTICYSSTKLNHYITLIVDDENLRIIGNGQISQYIEEKVYFYFKIPIKSSEIDREIEVAAVAGLKSRIKFSLSSEESNYVRGLLKKSLGFYGIDEKVDLLRLEFILATELNGLQLAHLRSCIENLHLITKSKKKCVQVKTEIPGQMDIQNLFFEEEFEIETDKDTNFSVHFENMYYGEGLRTIRKATQILKLVVNQNNFTITIIGDLENPSKKERIKFKFGIPMNKINNLELKKIITKRTNIEGKSTRRKICNLELIVYPDDFEMEIIRQKLTNLGCLIDLIRNHLEFSTTRAIVKSYEDCERILKLWQNSRNDGNLMGQEHIQTLYNERIVLICQSIHFGQFLYTGPNTCHISKSSDNSTKVSICMRDSEGEDAATLVISSSPAKQEIENFKVNFFLSDYNGSNQWILFFIPRPECQELFASILKYPQLKNLFDPSSEDIEKSHVRLVFEFPPSLQERDKKIEFCNKLNDIFDTYILSYIDLTAENNIKIIEKNLGRINNLTCMETG